MARKSKRLPDLGTSKKELTTTYNVGIYLRISVEERGSSTSSSIEYQKQLCLDYIKNKQDIALILCQQRKVNELICLEDSSELKNIQMK